MKVKPVILCGGSGTRLFPGVKNNPSKQFIDFGGWTLFDKTIDRIKSSIFDYPIISTNKIYKNLVLKGLKKHKIKKFKIILEPTKKNTAPAIIASTLLNHIEINQPVLFLPSDPCAGAKGLPSHHPEPVAQRSNTSRKLVPPWSSNPSPETHRHRKYGKTPESFPKPFPACLCQTQVPQRVKSRANASFIPTPSPLLNATRQIHGEVPASEGYSVPQSRCFPRDPQPPTSAEWLLPWLPPPKGQSSRAR